MTCCDCTSYGECISTCRNCFFHIQLEDDTDWCLVKQREVFEPCVDVRVEDDVLGQGWL